MTTFLHSQTLTFTDEEKKYIAEKVEKITHYSSKAQQEESVQVKFEVNTANGKDKDHKFVAAVTVNIPGKVLRAESFGTGVYDVVDDASRKVEGQIKKEKELHKHI